MKIADVRKRNEPKNLRICDFVYFKKKLACPLECTYITVEGLTLHFIYQRLDYFLKLPAHPPPPTPSSHPPPLPLPPPTPYPSFPPPAWAQAKHHEFWIWAGGPCSVCVEYLVMNYVWKHTAHSSRHRFILVYAWHMMRQKQVSSHVGSCLFIMFIMIMPLPQRMRARGTAATERWNLGAKPESLCKLSLTFSPYHLACFFYVRVVFY